MGDMFVDELFDQAAQIVLEAKQASVSLLQRRLRIGYTRAARLIDSMEAQNIIGPYEGSKPREVLMSLEQFHHNNVNS
jgi:S-DNA-T family DNA segregation ATPase FtsK/SpoIIIE